MNGTCNTLNNPPCPTCYLHTQCYTPDGKCIDSTPNAQPITPLEIKIITQLIELKELQAINTAPLYDEYITGLIHALEWMQEFSNYRSMTETLETINRVMEEFKTYNPNGLTTYQTGYTVGLTYAKHLISL